MTDATWGWAGTLSSLLEVQERDWLHELTDHHRRCMNSSPAASQSLAWRSSFSIVTTATRLLAHSRPEALGWTIVFEYELPRERGRRPDAILLARSAIIVLEFKQTPLVSRAHVDQVAAYARDLAHYHEGSHGRPVLPLLVLGGSSTEVSHIDGVTITDASRLVNAILSILGAHPEISLDTNAWLRADYAPLPSLVTAARMIFNHEALPQIRRAHSARVPLTIATLESIARAAQRDQERHLALVTGVPGAGKTLVGLQLVYSTRLRAEAGARPAIFLSGNGPLVRVLQHALASTIFVQDIHGFLKRYGGTTNRLPSEHIWIYDEAQRAWDSERVHEKRGHPTSEPDDFLRLGDRMPEWALLIGLIGEGQEIHVGEEAGIEQWNSALAGAHHPWTVHCPSKMAHLFTHAAHIHSDERLDLTQALRSHLAEDVPRWVTQLLEGQVSVAPDSAARLHHQGFDLYVTRALESAKTYVQERYAGQEDKRFGLLASSRAKNLPRWGVHNEWAHTRLLREGPWYNDPPSAPASCCQLRTVATEFACQGLELDLPIVAWGDDLLWQDQRWRSVATKRSKAKDPHRLRLNAYRVLLTRGRDGLVIFVPSEPSMDTTFAALRDMGVRDLA
jgi:hypothetical protein